MAIYEYYQGIDQVTKVEMPNKRKIMKIPVPLSPLIISAVRDAILYQESMLNSTTKNSEDYQEHIVQLSELLEFLKEEYISIESEAGIPLAKLL